LKTSFPFLLLAESEEQWNGGTAFRFRRAVQGRSLAAISNVAGRYAEQGKGNHSRYVLCAGMVVSYVAHIVNIVFMVKEYIPLRIVILFKDGIRHPLAIPVKMGRSRFF
jgi:hypothetical protein